jgi:hypothetical protein
VSCADKSLKRFDNDDENEARVSICSHKQIKVKVNTRIDDAARWLLDAVDVDVQLLLGHLVLTFDGNCANLVKTKIMIGVVQQIFRF